MGVYMGFRTFKRLPVEYGIRDTWWVWLYCLGCSAWCVVPEM